MTEDPKDWHEIISELGRRGVAFRVLNGGAHIKCRTVNFFPKTGRVNIDGAATFSQKGFGFFLEVLRDEKLLRP